MIEYLTTEKIPKWAICSFWNGDIDGLTDEEVVVMEKWESEMIDFAKESYPELEFAGFIYEFSDGEGAEPYFTNTPAFGVRNENALTRYGEPFYLACDVYDVDIYANYN